MISGGPTELQLIKERKEAEIVGVVIFILDQDNRVLVVRENTLKAETHRNVGEYGVICETRNPNESMLGNIRRALWEELGLPKDNLGKFFDFSDRKIWETGFVGGVWATTVVVKCRNSELLLKEANPSDEIEIIGWKTRDEFRKLTPIRKGVLNILDKSEKNVFRNEKFNFD